MTAPRPDHMSAGHSYPYQYVQAMIDAVPTFAAVHAAVKLGVFDVLALAPMTRGMLANVAGADPEAMARLLALLHSRGFVTESGTGGYRITDLGRVLTAEAGVSQRHAVLVTGSSYWWQTIGSLADVIRNGRPLPPDGLAAYEHLAVDEELGEQFDQFMTVRSSVVGRDLASVDDWADVRTMADLGGGRGGVLATLLHAHPHLRGVLAERRDVTVRARTYLAGAGLIDRVDIMPADIFEKIPRGAERYLLSSILHNYGDETCACLLADVREALEDNGGGQVWIVEGMLPDTSGVPSPWYSTDMRMMSLFAGGRVRRVSQVQVLVDQAGLRVRHVQELPCGQTLMVAQLPGDEEERFGLREGEQLEPEREPLRISDNEPKGVRHTRWAAPA